MPVTSPAPRPQPLVGRFSRLEPVRSADVPFLFDLYSDPEMLEISPFRDALPSEADFVSHPWSVAFVQFVPVDLKSRMPCGHYVLSNASLRDGWSYVSAWTRTGPNDGYGRIEGLVLFLDFAFRNWNFRKLYFEVPADRLGQFDSSIRRYAAE